MSSDLVANRRKNRDKEKKKKEEDEDDDDELDKKGGLYGEDDEFFKKWAGPVLLGPFLPAIFAFFIIVAGQLILNSANLTCGYPLDTFVQVEIATCYLFLLVFSWVYLGDTIRISVPSLSIDWVLLVPFQSLKWIMWFYFYLGVMSFIVGIYGAFVLSLATFCKTTAPTLYTFSLFCVILYWLGLFFSSVYLVNLFFGNSISKFIAEKTREDTMEEVEERIFKKQFQEFDKDNEGKIVRSDMPKILKNLGVFVPEEEVEQLANNFDPENTGFILYQPFANWFKELNKEAEKKSSKAGGVGDSDESDNESK